MNYIDYSAVPLPCLHSSEDFLLNQRELTQQYHQVLAEQEIGFRGRLHQLLLQPHSLQKQILQPKFNKKLQQYVSRSPISGRGWCAICCVDCHTESVLEKHFLGKKHQAALTKLKEGTREGSEENSKQKEPNTEQQQEEQKRVSVKEIGELNEKQQMMESKSEQQK